MVSRHDVLGCSVFTWNSGPNERVIPNLIRDPGLWKEKSMLKSGFVYILSNQKRGTLYVGVTNDLCRRVWEHKNQLVPGFTKKYGLTKLVYYEDCDNIIDAIEREKKLKAWRRSWKVVLIEKDNPKWNDLYYYVCV